MILNFWDDTIIHTKTMLLVQREQFPREHHYKINHCFLNTRGTGFVLFDTKEDVNEWYKKHTEHLFYTEVYEKGTKLLKLMLYCRN